MHLPLLAAIELHRLPFLYEPFSAISHLIAAVLFLLLGVMLVWRGRGSLPRQIFLAVYAVSCVVLFSMSTMFHVFPTGSTERRVFERLDHAAIFLLIVASFTPIHGLLFRGKLRWLPLLILWTAAITGITLKSIFFDSLHKTVGLSFYLGLGWCGLVSSVLVAQRYGWKFVRLVVLGGVAYSVGAIAEAFRWPILVPGYVHPHDVFHVMVIVGAFIHWIFIWRLADGRAYEDHLIEVAARAAAETSTPAPSATATARSGSASGPLGGEHAVG